MHYRNRMREITEKRRNKKRKSDMSITQRIVIFMAKASLITFLAVMAGLTGFALGSPLS